MKQKYQDETLSFKERAKDLVDRMSVEECASQMLFEAAKIERLGVQSFNWWNEALHGAARSGMATVFPQAIGMASTFDAALLERRLFRRMERILMWSARREGPSTIPFRNMKITAFIRESPSGVPM